MTQLISILGGLSVASRLKLLSERLMQDVSKVYREQNIDFEPRWFLIFYQLTLKSPMSITEIAASVGITHPAVNQIAAEMNKAGIIDSFIDKKDKRRRLLSLSNKGKTLIDQIKPIWEDIEHCTTELIVSAGDDFLLTLGKIENSLTKEEMYNRVKSRIKQRMLDKIGIYEYKPEYKKYFKKINYEWLKKYFYIEPSDRDILSDPENLIIKNGGFVFFAKYENEIAGTCALIKHNEKIYELAKMGVLEHYQGKHIGTKMMIAVIEKAKNINAEYIYLTSHVRLTSAVKMYKKFGFELAKPLHDIVYARKGVTMRLHLRNDE